MDKILFVIKQFKHLIFYILLVIAVIWFCTVLIDYSGWFRDTNPRYMKLTKRHGRTGNQLFQYAMLLSTARRYGYIPVLPSDFPLKEYMHMNVKLDLDLKNVKNFTEKGRGIYSEEIKQLDTKYNWSFDGWYQSYKYHDKMLLQSESLFKPEVLKPARDFMAEVTKNSETTVCVHVRRGDFTVTRPGFGHVVASAKYIRGAMAYYRTKLESPIKFIVLSDGIDWCKENLRGTDIVFSNLTNPGHDLALTSLCDHMIATCGTFSWWGGWFSGGHVVYYKKYPMAGLPESTQIEPVDFYPPDWIGMDDPQ